MDSARRYIGQLTAGETIDEVFLVREKDLRTTANGALYITCTLTDRSGKLPGRMWQATETLFRSIPTDGFVHVRGRTESYRGSLQCIIDGLRPHKADGVDLADFMPCSVHDPEQMWAELLSILRGVKNPHPRMLIKKFVEDRSFVEAYKRSPAAMEMHQAYVHGLLEHTLQICRAAKALLPLYPMLNGDLLLTGAFMHDMGKTAELTSDLGFGYTDRGQLVGHITLAAIWIQQKADLVAAETNEPFPPRIVDLLQHMVLSHHGCYEYGSPKLPMTPEAMALHYLDNLDAKMNMFQREIAADIDPKSSFTSYHRSLGVRMYKRSDEIGPASEDVSGEERQ